MIYRLSKFFLLILFFFALDQISKNIIIQLYNIDVENLSSQFLTSINEYVNLYLIWNKGFAFGLFQNDIRTVNNIYMILMAIIIVVVFIYALTINSKVYY